MNKFLFIKYFQIFFGQEQQISWYYSNYNGDDNNDDSVDINNNYNDFYLLMYI